MQEQDCMDCKGPPRDKKKDEIKNSANRGGNLKSSYMQHATLIKMQASIHQGEADSKFDFNTIQSHYCNQISFI